MTQGPYGAEPYPQQPAAPQPGYEGGYAAPGYQTPSGGYAAPGYQTPAGGYVTPGYQTPAGDYASPGYQSPQPAYQAAYPPPAAAYPPHPGGYGIAPRNGLGTAALVLGIIGIVLCWIPVTGWALNILAVIFGGVGMGRAKRGEATNRSSALAGLVLGAIGLAVWVVVFVYFVAAVGTATTYFS